MESINTERNMKITYKIVLIYVNKEEHSTEADVRPLIHLYLVGVMPIPLLLIAKIVLDCNLNKFHCIHTLVCTLNTLFAKGLFMSELIKNFIVNSTKIFSIILNFTPLSS